MQQFSLLFDASADFPPTRALPSCSSQVKTCGFPLRITPKPVSLDADIRAVCEHRGAECQVWPSGRITIDSSPGVRLLMLRRLKSQQYERAGGFSRLGRGLRSVCLVASMLSPLLRAQDQVAACRPKIGVALA